jgi:hypothetical protein
LKTSASIFSEPLKGGNAISTCRFCNWLRNWLTDGRGHPCDAIDELSTAWEYDNSNEWELWNKEPDVDRLKSAELIQSTDPKAAFQIYLELAQIGSVRSMTLVAWHYAYGLGKVVESDDALAHDWYCRAIEGGSWMATRYYAQYQQSRGNIAHCEQMLEMGVNSDWIPAYFWLAHYRIKHSKSRNIYKEIRPLLEYAADKGHPWAKAKYSSLMLYGRFGLREIRHGFKLRMAFCAELAKDAESDAEVVGGDLADGVVKAN